MTMQITVGGDLIVTDVVPVSTEALVSAEVGRIAPEPPFNYLCSAYARGVIELGLGEVGTAGADAAANAIEESAAAMASEPNARVLTPSVRQQVLVELLAGFLWKGQVQKLRDAIEACRDLPFYQVGGSGDAEREA